MLNAVVRAIDCLSEFCGRIVAAALPIMVLTTIAVIALAKVFGTGWIWMSEIVVYLHGILFMMAASYTLLHGGHVRVDVFYSRMTERHKAWIDLLGSIIFLIPMNVVIIYYSSTYVADSWAVRESSPEGQGLPALYLLKTCLLLMPILLILQGFSLAVKSARRILQ